MQNKDLANTAVLTDETQVIKKLLPKIKCPALEQQKIIARADEFISIIRKSRNLVIIFLFQGQKGVRQNARDQTAMFYSPDGSSKIWETFKFGF